VSQFIWQDLIGSIVKNWEKYKSKWRRIPNGMVFTDVSDSEYWYNILGPSAYKTFGVSGIPNNKPTAAIGGMCLIYSGDIQSIRSGKLPNGETLDSERVYKLRKWIDTLPRIDQIIDSIGPPSLGCSAVVFEDDIFANLIGNILGLSSTETDEIQASLKQLGEKSYSYIKKWLAIAGGVSVVVPVYTSVIKPEIDAYLKSLSEAARKPDMLKEEKSKINMMYTTFWPKLLKEKGYIPAEDVLCLEPFQHFLEMAIGEGRKEGYNGLENFFAENPWAGPGINSGFSVAGFIPSLKSSKTGKSPFSKYLPQNIVEQSDKSNPDAVIRDAVNIAFFDRECRERVIQLYDGCIEEMEKLKIRISDIKKSVRC
jgi:hypothetical protein